MLRSPLFALSLLLVACSDNATTPAPEGQGASTPPPRRFLSNQNQTPPDATQAQPAQVTGTVLEATDAAGYTYLRLKTPQGEIWAAVTQAAVQVNSQVTIGGGSWMQDFPSKTLNKTFDRILFGALVGPVAAAGNQSRPQSQPAGHAGGEADPVQMAHAGVQSGGAELGEIKVQKAEGAEGRTIAEVHAAKATLKDKPVAVRGKVVKFNGGILGRNWVHVRDGSGSADQQTDDLTVTTEDTVTVGDVVLVRGTVVLDKDFGAGYSYPVLVEGAKLTK